ncbi:cytochrome c [Fulvivirga sp. RKSG066]|uniref:c-type cytochrome n=1 Tax=Fulvivirga aurantia TaxID=2529383 RepID=UPI0012BC6E0E|nr:cytochrome c [Fulvivirga aurantia]MTI22835.1 cytochrome c [Fulvivirga aurantia]
MKLYNNLKLASVLAIGVALTSCGAGGEDQGLEYAPNMYHSVPYEPLSQIVDETAGEAAEFLDPNTDDKHGEYYNSNPYNPSRMTMRVPPANSVPRKNAGYILPYRIPKDSLDYAARTLQNPLTEDKEALLAEGNVLYSRYCNHCHGPNGEGDGPVAGTEDKVVFAGIANLQGAAYQNITEGHIFHVISQGKGLMGAHGSQVSQEDRWKIAMYVKKLQNQ